MLIRDVHGRRIKLFVVASEVGEYILMMRVNR